MVRWAHRGWHHDHNPLENTWPAFAHAVAAGAQGIELDVQRSADGVAVVIHDPSLGRLTGGRDQRRVDALPWSTLAKIPLEGGASIHSLAEVLARLRGRIKINVELKTHTVTAPALAAICTQDEVILSSFVAEALREAQRLRPALPRALLTDEAQKEAPLRLLAALRCVAWHAAASSLTESSVARAHQAGYAVRAYTVNDPELAARLARWGVDGIFTDLLGQI